QVTVQTNPVGLSFTVDGATYTSTQTFSWQPGSSHTVATTSPQSGGSGKQYTWANWSGGGSISHTVTPTTNTTYTATFSAQYYLTMSTGAGGTVTPGSGWKNSGTTQSISAKAATGYTFSGWTGSGTASYSGTNNPASVTINGPITEAATFTKNPTPTPTPTPTANPTPSETPTPTATPAVQITIQTNPAGCSFAVDGTTYTSTQTFSWTPG